MKKYLNCEYTDQEKMRKTIDGILWRITQRELIKK